MRNILAATFLLPAFLLAPAILLAQASPPGPMLLIANQGDQNISIIDPATARQVAVVPVTGVTGHEVATYPGGRVAFVPIYSDAGVGRPGTNGSYIDVIDIPTRKVTGKIDFGHGVRPHCAVYEPHSGLLYVTTELEHSVAIIDPRTLKIRGSIPTGQAESHMLAISSDGRYGYTANVGPGTVSVLDIKARKTLTIIPISTQTQRISISKDDKWVFTADQAQPQLAVIDTATNKVAKRIPLAAAGYGTASTNDGHFLLITIPSLNAVAVMDLSTLAVVRTIEVGKHPTEILVRPDGKVAYVACMASNNVAAIDLTTWKLQALIAVGQASDGMAWYQ